MVSAFCSHVQGVADSGFGHDETHLPSQLLQSYVQTAPVVPKNLSIMDSTENESLGFQLRASNTSLPFKFWARSASQSSGYPAGLSPATSPLTCEPLLASSCDPNSQESGRVADECLAVTQEHSAISFPFGGEQPAQQQGEAAGVSADEGASPDRTGANPPTSIGTRDIKLR